MLAILSNLSPQSFCSAFFTTTRTLFSPWILTRTPVPDILKSTKKVAVLWSRWRSEVFLMPHERRNPHGFLWCRYGKIFYRHAALFFSLRPSSCQREGACHVNRIITSQSPLQRAALPPWLPICTAEHRCQGRAARRSRFLDCGGLLCHTRQIRRKLEYEKSIQPHG